MRAIRSARRAIFTVAALTTAIVAIGVTSAPAASAADAAAPETAVLLPQHDRFACQMVDKGAGLDAWVYCWEEGGKRIIREVELDPEGRISLTASAPKPTGIGGPGQPDGTWVTIGRFRCEILQRGTECVAIASGAGFLITPTEIIAIQTSPGVAEPSPVLGQSATLKAISGTVRIKAPGSTFFFSLAGSGARVPLGTVIDVSRGTVELSSAADAGGAIQTGRFRGGVFRVTQPGSPAGSGQPEGLTMLKLVGRLPAGCGQKTSRRGGTAAARRGSKGRRLWGDAHGNFQTGGRYASATVGGTKWLTEDSCAGTLVKVVRGVVTVNDFIHHRTVLVTASHSFLAHPGRSGSPTGKGPLRAPLWGALEGKVICGLAAHAAGAPGLLLCASRQVPAPKPTGSSEGDPGFVYLESAGSPRPARLSQYSWESEDGWDPAQRPELAAGQKWSSGAVDVTCTISASAVRCANGSGHGFTITKSSYRGF